MKRQIRWKKLENIITTQVFKCAFSNNRTKACKNLLKHQIKQSFHHKKPKQQIPTKNNSIIDQNLQKTRERDIGAIYTGSRSEREGRLRSDSKWDLSLWPRRPVFLLCQRAETNWSSASSDFTPDSLCNCRYSEFSPTSIAVLLFQLKPFISFSPVGFEFYHLRPLEQALDLELGDCYFNWTTTHI